MEEHKQLFSFIRKQNRFSASLALVTIISMLMPSGIAFAEDSNPFYYNREAVGARQFSEPSNVPNGAFNYSAPIVTPPGRNGIQPNLQFSYSSSPDKEGSIFGYGWSVNVPYIERINKLGVDKLYNQTKANTFFYSSLSGELLDPPSNVTIVGGDDFASSATTPEPTIATISVTSATPTFDDPFDAVIRPDGKSPDGPVEVAALRTLTSQTYWAGNAPDGKRLTQMHFYGSPAFYQDANSKTYQPIDATFTKSGDGFAMKHAAYQSTVGSGGHLISFAHDGQELYLDTEATSSASTTISQPDPSTISYANYFGPGIDLEVHTLRDRLVKEVVVRNKDALGDLSNRKTYDIPFLLSGNSALTLTADGQTLSTTSPLTTNGRVTITDANNVTSYILPPVARGSTGTNTDIASSTPVIPIDITYTATTSGVELVKHIPVSFFDTATYPIRTDATLSFQYATGSGYILLYGQSTWSAAHDAASAGAVTGAGGSWGAAVLGGYYAPGGGYEVYRAFMPVDTSDLPDGANITSAQFFIRGYDHVTGDADSHTYFTLVGTTTQATATALVGDDFDQSTTTTITDRKIMYSDPWSTSGSPTSTYTNFPLNATGTGMISRTGFTMIGAREGHDLENVAPSNENYWTFFIDGTDSFANGKWPYLEVTYTPGPEVPSIPTDLQLESQVNPVTVATSNPRFSGVYHDDNATDTAEYYQIQVTSSSTSWTSPYWDSGKKAIGSSTPVGQRSPQIYSTTTFPHDGTTYYWRMKFWDQAGLQGLWSTTTATFQMNITGDYGAKVESGDFTHYSLTATNTWTAYDKKGNFYRFGHSSSTQLYNTGSATNTFRWYLEEMRDPNGNSMTYSYATTSVQSGYSSQLYPYKISYTANGASTALYEVEFLRENRTDIATSSAYGFPVVTNQRIKEILVRTNGLLTHRYQLAYNSGDNGVRSLLSSMTESGWDAGVGTTTLPAVTLGYSTSTPSWTQVTSTSTWNIPGYFTNGTCDCGYREADVNGDGLLDILQGLGSATKVTYLNTGSDWKLNATWAPPVEFTTGYGSWGTEFADINGDGLLDVIHAVPGENQVYLNNGNGWSLSATWTSPVLLAYGGGPTITDARVVDVNGDGLADIISGTSGTYINTGSGWVLDTSWAAPHVFSSSGYDQGERLADVNGDGLVDIVWGQDTTKQVYLNTSHGWTLDPSWVLPDNFVGITDSGLRFADINGDGLPDLVQKIPNYPGPTYPSVVYMNTGKGWQSVSTWTLPELTGYDTADVGTRFDDVNGDGFVDVLRSTTGYNSVDIKDGVKADFLNSITNEKGGRTTVGYQASPLYQSNGSTTNPHLPLVLDTVKTITLNSGFGAISTSTYSYAGGEYYFSAATPTDRQFAGFASTTKQNDQGHTVRTYFHQGDMSDSANGEYLDHVSKIGKPYRIEVADGTTTSANIYSRTINRWARTAYSDGRNFVKLIQSLTQTYDGDSTHRDTAASTTYDDTNGNVTEQDNNGEVTGNSDGTFTDIGTDKASTTYTYAASSTNATMSLLSRELVTDQSGVTVKDTKNYFDGLSFGSVSAGNVTNVQSLTSGSHYASTTKQYNSYGLVNRSLDANGNATTFVYDSFNLYPATATNAKSQNLTFAYDYSSGKVATSSDENGKTIVTDFDGLDRPTKEKQPDFVTPTTLVTKSTYTYTDSTTTPSSILRSDYLSSGTSTDFYAYVDGWGRTIQTKKEAEPANGYEVRDTLYNNIGSVDQNSLPYFSTTSSYVAATSSSALYSVYRYDPQGRVKTVADALGTTTNIYNDWTLTVTDPLSNRKDLAKDAYGNLASVVEYPNATSSATTTYTWNLLGKLTKLTDALANVRNFTYDNLGRLLTSQDLHASADTTYGTTSRQYDDVGNLIQVYTPLGTTITYTYDSLNRVLTEDSTSTANLTDVVYTYEGCTNGTGRLCQVQAHRNATTTYSYNPIGLLSSETVKTSPKSGNTYEISTTSYQYYRNGANDTITYPDSAIVTYVYDDAGLPEQVINKESGVATTTVVQRMTWSPLEQIVSMEFPNGPLSTSTYDQTKKYRLMSKYAKAKSGGNIVQDITYTYDAVNNITKLVDNGSSTARKTIDYVYDNLYRLKSASTSVVATSTSQYREDYNYDALGNMTTKTGTAYTYSGSGYADPDAVTSIGASSWTYDNAGNALTAGSATYAYDYLNRLATTTIAAVNTLNVYAFDGSRVTQKGATTTYYQGKLYEYTPGGYQKDKHLFVGSQLVSTIEKTGAAAAGVRYVLTDQLSGSSVITDSAGAVVESLDYLPYGDIRGNMKTSTFNDSRKYIGERYDSDTSLSYLQARMYDGRVGKFTTQDPMFTGDPNQQRLLLPQDLNSYSYADDNPINKSDPTGRAADPLDVLMLANSFFIRGAGQIFGNQNMIAYADASIPIDAGGLAVPVVGTSFVGAGAPVLMGLMKNEGKQFAKSEAKQVVTQTEKQAARATSPLVGQTFGQIGIVISNQAGAYKELGRHAQLNIANGRITKEALDGAIANPLVTLSQAGGQKTVYITKNAYVVVDNNNGRVVTAFGQQEFRPEVKQIISAASK